MAYTQNNPFSRKASSPLNHGTHKGSWNITGSPIPPHEGHGGNDERSGRGPYEGYDTIEELRANRINVDDETAKLLKLSGGSGSYNREAINAHLKRTRDTQMGKRAYENLFNSPQRSKLYDFNPETMVDW